MSTLADLCNKPWSAASPQKITNNLWRSISVVGPASTVCWTACSGWHQTNYQVLYYWAFVSRINRWPVDWRIASQAEIVPMSTWPQEGCHWPLNKYVKLRVAHALGMPGTFSPPPRVSDPDMHHGTFATCVPWCMPGSLTSRWRGKAFPAHAQPQFYVSGKRSIAAGPDSIISPSPGRGSHFQSRYHHSFWRTWMLCSSIRHCSHGCL